MNKAIFLSFVFVCAVSFSNAQKIQPVSKDMEKDVSKEAASLFKQENYREAVIVYERLINSFPENVDYNYNLGMCYLKTWRNKEKAFEYFHFASQQKDAPKDVLYQLGIAYHAAGEYDKAIESFDKYKAANNGSVSSKLELDRWTDWCANAKGHVNTAISVEFENLGKNINSTYSDFRPMVSADDSLLVYCSNRKGNTGGLVDAFGEYPTDVYYVARDSVYGKGKNAGINVNSEGYEESMYLDPSGTKLLVYRESADASGDIYYSELKGKSWQKSFVLSKIFKTDPYETGATLSPDGNTIIFASENKGVKTALGGKDLYVSTRSQFGEWSEPVNLGAPVNSKYDENYPYLCADGNTLLYASNGHNTMGGYDIFKTSRKSASEPWSPPVNIGYPINSQYDDMGMTLMADGVTGYLSTYKPNGMGELDIYKFMLKNSVFDQKLHVLRGRVITINNTIGKNLLVSITNKNTGESMGEYYTNSSTGKFLAVLSAGNYIIKIVSDKQGRIEEEFSVSESEEYMIDRDFNLSLN